MDQTANLNFDSLERSLYNSKVLVIGSGQDLDDRKLGQDIDYSNRWDYILRLNKTYGDPIDSGRRTDILVTRWSQWISEGSDFVEPNILHNCKKVIILNQFVNYSKTESEMLCREVGKESVSAGPQAVHWLLNRGCRHIDLIGFGYRDGEFMSDKIYARNSKNYEAGYKDTNDHYDWALERKWLLGQPAIHFI